MSADDDLTKDERLTLEWLGKEDWSAYAECHGHALDALRQKGLAALAYEPPTGNTGVRLTEAGWALLVSTRTGGAP